MRIFVWAVMVAAAVGLAGCGSQAGTPVSGSGRAAGPAAVTGVSGTVGLVHPRTLSGQAVMTIKLVDLSSPNAPALGTRTVAPVNGLPVKFKFAIAPGQVNSTDIYTVQASMFDAARHFTQRVPSPVLTHGAPTQVTIRLVAQPTPAEKMLAAYRKVKADLGSFALSTGTSRGKKSSRGWQVFRSKSDGSIVFVRELVDHYGKDFVHTNFAYKDGSPWVVVRSVKPGQHAKPTGVERAGWGADGSLVVEQHVVKGKTGTLCQAAAQRLHRDALAMLKTAQTTH